ncbi:MAG: methyltransferase domain-containing protein [Magnetococcales bacterium]|nr:methyltransferase domain-containing protein [Magnetococcales bacterium]
MSSSSVRIRYQTIEFGKMDIHIRSLRDRQEYSDPIGTAFDLGIYSSSWSLFGVIWASGELLAHLMSEYEIKGLRILEVGCGIGLASLVLNHRSADITATDYHPEAETFLMENAKLNKDESIPFLRANWSEEQDALGKFDLIIGSDLLYEMGHAKALSNFINRHANPGCKVILIDPGRSHHSKFSKRMIELGYSFSKSSPQSVQHLTQPMRHAVNFHILRYTLT